MPLESRTLVTLQRLGMPPRKAVEMAYAFGGLLQGFVTDFDSHDSPVIKPQGQCQSAPKRREKPLASG
jgi:hypothetical protein